MDGEAWQVTIHGVAKSQIQLSDWTLHLSWNLPPGNVNLHICTFTLLSSLLEKELVFQGTPHFRPHFTDHQVFLPSDTDLLTTFQHFQLSLSQLTLSNICQHAHFLQDATQTFWSKYSGNSVTVDCGEISLLMANNRTSWPANEKPSVSSSYSEMWDLDQEVKYPL